ncbi:MAG: putative DNA modification/repair radical SAM protein [Coriobacteriales bacterium]|jgi:putative DNA modification/repair radical SAM protein|nr:putative DNA modification/repair radical SAM protein [Coriobacteriales bacterium]
MELLDKLTILADAAKYDVACTSCGVNRGAIKGQLGSTTQAGICHTFSADGRCVTLLKVLLSNVCSYDCVYCVNRRTNDVPRATFTARELAELTIGFYRRNYIEGLFLSSGVLHSPDYTTERMCEAIQLLRDEYGFRGYIHAKAIPGTSNGLLVRLGVLVDRVSLNIELPSEKSLKLLAPEKSSANTLVPMAFVRDGIKENYQDKRLSIVKRTRFAPAGQSTQMIVGATPESDLQILRLSASLYKQMEMRRVFFSAYIPVNASPLLPDMPTGLPGTSDIALLREHRLYQADWLMRFYEFSVEEIVSEENPFLDPLIDPKCSWALRHMDLFPVEINKANYEMLLRIPGIGVRGAKRIVVARRERRLRFDDLKRLNVSMKRARYFITCNGIFAEGVLFDPLGIYNELVRDAEQTRTRRKKGVLEGQMQLFSEPSTFIVPTLPDSYNVSGVAVNVLQSSAQDVGCAISKGACQDINSGVSKGASQDVAQVAICSSAQDVGRDVDHGNRQVASPKDLKDIANAAA